MIILRFRKNSFKKNALKLFTVNEMIISKNYENTKEFHHFYKFISILY